jgi:hypothetical protein
MEIGDLPQTQSFYANLHRARRYVNQEYGTPAVLTKRDEKYYLAVASTTKKDNEIPGQLQVSGIQGITINLRLREQPQTISLTAIDDTYTHMVEDFLSFELRSAFRGCRKLWRGGSPYIYYTKQVVDQKAAHQRQICIYPGFRYRVRVIDGSIYFAIDITHVYVDNRTLAERITQGDEWRHLSGRHFLYEFGPRWYFTQLQEVSHLPVSEAEFEHPNGSGQHISVYDYTQQEWDNHPAIKRLQPNDDAFVYNNPGQKNERIGATTLARLRYNTTDAEVGQLHSKTILSAYNRLNQQKAVIAEYCNGQIELNGKSVQISQRPKEINAKRFSLPAFKFGNGQVLRTGRSRDDFQGMLSTRKSWLRADHIGPFTSQLASMSQFILAPLSVASDEDLMDRLREDILKAVNRISQQDYEPDVVVWDNNRARTIPQVKRELEPHKQQMQAAGGLACALVILPDGYSPGELGKLRRHIKTMLWPVRTKCIQASEVTSYLRQTPNGYTVKNNIYWSYLYYTALKLLIVSGARPWVLADPLNYDLYIGIDVLNNVAGFSFLGAGGELLHFKPFPCGDRESLTARQIAAVLLDKDSLPRFIERLQCSIGRLPRHLVIHRDGRSYDTELEGYQHVVRELQSNKLLTPDTKLGVVEIHKSNSESLRMYHMSGERVNNPLIGRYHIFDNQWGVVATTGYPALTQGTAAPLVARIKHGDLSMENVLQDIFNLSMLSWTKPDGIQSTPITIKILDDWLESIAADVDENEGLLDEIEVEAV